MIERDEPELHVYAAGPTTVVGFGGADVLDHVNLALCRDQIVQLIQDNSAEVIAFDLTGVVLMPSGLLGLLASLKQLGVAVHVYNPSDDVRDVLAVTHLDRMIEIHEVEVSSVSENDDS